MGSILGRSKQKIILPNPLLKVDWSNPVTKDLLFACVPGNSLTDLVGASGIGTLQGGSDTNNGIYSTCIEGPGITSAGSHACSFYNSTNDLNTWTNATLYFRASFTSGGASGNGCFLTSSPTIGWGIFAVSANTFQLMWGPYTTGTTGATVSVPAMHSLSAVFLAASAKSYLDGVLYTTDATTTVPTAAGGHVAFAASAVAASTAVYVWKRALSVTEILGIDADPYGFLIPVLERGIMPMPAFLPVPTNMIGWAYG
jgi:hypothetical protein